MPPPQSNNSVGGRSYYTTSSVDMSSKAKEIEQLLSEEQIDLWKLRELALSEGGLVNGKNKINQIN